MSWRRIVMVSLVLVAALVTGTWFWLQRSDAATQVVRRELQAWFRPAVHVATTELDLAAGRLTARGVRIDDPERPGEPLLTVQQVDVDVAVASGGSLFGVHRVVLDGAVFAAGPDWPSAATLLVPREGGGSPARIPAIEVRRGRVRASLRDGEPPVELADVALTLAPRGDGDDHVLALRGSAALAELGTRVVLDGEVDAVTGAVRASATVGDAVVDTATIARVAALAGAAAPDVDASASLRTLRVTLQVPPDTAPDRTPRLAVAADLDGVAVRAGQLPALVTAATVELRADERDGGSATLRLR